jgi:hypothetical protein
LPGLPSKASKTTGFKTWPAAEGIDRIQDTRPRSEKLKRVSPMAEIALSGKERLAALETEIRAGLDTFYSVGMKLKAIRDDELYKEAGFQTWEKYCKERWEWDRTYVSRVILSAEYWAVLPTVPNGTADETGIKWSESSVRELRRLESKRDAARVAKKVVEEVEKTPGAKLTAGLVRKAVDKDLGIDRAADAKEHEKKMREMVELAEKVQRDREERKRFPELHQFLFDESMRIKATVEKLNTVGDDDLKVLAKQHPLEAKLFAEACKSLVEFSRRVRLGAEG